MIFFLNGWHKGYIKFTCILALWNTFIYNISNSVEREREGRSHGLVPDRGNSLPAKDIWRQFLWNCSRCSWYPQVTSVDVPHMWTTPVVKIPCWLMAFYLEYLLHMSLIFCLRFFSEVEPEGVCSAYVQSQSESLESQFLWNMLCLSAVWIWRTFVQYTFFQTCLTILVCAFLPPWEPLHLNHLHVSGSTFGELKLIWKFYKNLLYNTVYLFIH